MVASAQAWFLFFFMVAAAVGAGAVDVDKSFFEEQQQERKKVVRSSLSNWTKTRHFHSVRRMPAPPLQDYNWTAALDRVQSSMESSFASGYADSAESADLALVQALVAKEHTVWIVDGELYVEKAFLGAMKSELHLRLMRTALANAKRLGMKDVITNKKQKKVLAYAFQSSASGSSKCDANLPMFVIAKKYADQCGVSIPNPYFGDVYGEWQSDFKRLQELALKSDWSRRNPRVFWRGAIREHGESKKDARCERDSGNYARVSASALTLRFSESFDVRPVQCANRKAKADCDANVYGLTDFERKAQESNCKVVLGKFVPHATFAKYKFVLDLPGSTSGSYSRNLNHLWLLGAVVLIWTGPNVDEKGADQWYSPALQDDHTHLVVDRDSAPVLVDAVNKDPLLRKYLLNNTKNVANRLLCPDCIVLFLFRVLRALQTHLPQFIHLLNAQNTQVAQRRKNILHDKDRCHKLNLFHVVANEIPGRAHKTPIRVHVKPIKESACDLLDASSS